MNIVNVMLWMKKNAYEDSTIKKVAKLLRHLRRNCNTTDPEAVKLFVANKTCGNGHKENLIEAYDLYIQSEDLKWNKPFYQRYDKKRKAPLFREEKIPKEAIVVYRALRVSTHVFITKIEIEKRKESFFEFSVG